VHLGKQLSAPDFAIPAPEGAATVKAKVIGIVENQAPTKALSAVLQVRDGLVQPETETDIAQVALVERHRGTGSVANGFVSGFGYQGDMAMASTVAHDSHQMIVVGTCRENMALAANRLGEVSGGMVIFKDGQEIALVELPIAGLMSDEPAKEVAIKAQGIVDGMRACGCTLNNANIQHSFLALVVIPELRLSDLGLVDVVKFELTDLLESTT
jgi:adenine deaminase